MFHQQACVKRDMNTPLQIYDVIYTPRYETSPSKIQKLVPQYNVGRSGTNDSCCPSMDILWYEDREPISQYQELELHFQTLLSAQLVFPFG